MVENLTSVLHAAKEGQGGLSAASAYRHQAQGSFLRGGLASINQTLILSFPWPPRHEGSRSSTHSGIRRVLAPTRVYKDRNSAGMVLLIEKADQCGLAYMP